MTSYAHCMTMVSFRVAENELAEIEAWATRLGVRRSELLREAVRRHLLRLASEVEADTYQLQPFTREESLLADVADWGPAEDWVDWGDAAR